MTLLKELETKPNYTRRLVVFTDGVDNFSSADNKKKHRAMIKDQLKKLRALGIIFHVGNSRLEEGKLEADEMGFQFRHLIEDNRHDAVKDFVERFPGRHSVVDAFLAKDKLQPQLEMKASASQSPSPSPSTSIEKEGQQTLEEKENVPTNIPSPSTASHLAVAQ